MPPFHALQDQIVSVLKGQMHERRKSRFRHGLHQGIIYLDGVDGGNTQLLQLRRQFQDALDQIAELRRARQVCAPACEVHAGQHNFIMAGLDEASNLIDHLPCRDRPGIPTAIRNDAERAAMVTSILDLDISAGATFHAINQVCSGFPH